MLTLLPRHPAAIALVLILGTLSLAAQSTHTVVRIIDGDTVELSQLGTVRLIGVDAPETVDQRKPVEEFGRASAAFLAGLALGKTVRVEYDQAKTDRLNRTLAYLYLSDGTLVNREIVRRGYGHVLTEFPFRLMADFHEAALEAQSMNLGLWGAGLGAGEIRTLTPGMPVGTGVDPAMRVYVTRTGSKYHLASCRSLSSSRIATTLREASERYGDCGICRPPTLGAVPSSSPGSAPKPPTAAAPARIAPPLPPARSSPQRCAATTKAGTRCSRNACAGSAYCWQHGRNEGIRQ